jgi:hypothetical protein
MYTHELLGPNGKPRSGPQRLTQAEAEA